jgi:hypothetical protein
MGLILLVVQLYAKHPGSRIRGNAQNRHFCEERIDEHNAAKTSPVSIGRKYENVAILLIFSYG